MSRRQPPAPPAYPFPVFLGLVRIDNGVRIVRIDPIFSQMCLCISYLALCFTLLAGPFFDFMRNFFTFRLRQSLVEIFYAAGHLVDLQAGNPELRRQLFYKLFLFDKGLVGHCFAGIQLLQLRQNGIQLRIISLPGGGGLVRGLFFSFKLFFPLFGPRVGQPDRLHYFLQAFAYSDGGRRYDYNRA